MTSYTQLTQHERYMISAQRTNRMSVASIAQFIGRSKSTIYRELKRNATRYDGHYRADRAHTYSNTRRAASRKGTRYSYEDQRKVLCRLKQLWSPEQIAGSLKGKLAISHQSIYTLIHKNRHSGGDWFTFLRIVPKFGRKHRGTPFTRGIGPNKVHISERPPEAQTRSTVGHWEGDTVIGKDKHACLLTMVERKSGLTRIRKLNHRSTAEVNPQLIAMLTLHNLKFKSVTLDNGTEFHQFKEVQDLTGVPFFFCTPYHSWERGTNENTNGLIRQYIPKGTCMKDLTQKQCDLIAYKLNTRPRKRLGFKTPLQVYNA